MATLKIRFRVRYGAQSPLPRDMEKKRDDAASPFPSSQKRFTRRPSIGGRCERVNKLPSVLSPDRTLAASADFLGEVHVRGVLMAGVAHP